MKNPRKSEEIWNSLRRELKHNLSCADWKIVLMQQEMHYAGMKSEEVNKFIAHKFAELMQEIRNERTTHEGKPSKQKEEAG